jgi:hypothetical protein
MNSTSPTTPAVTTRPAATPILPSSSDAQSSAPRPNPPAARPVMPKATGYGMPCSNCKTYYAADVKVCPVCKATERVSTKAVALRVTAVAETCPDPVVLEEERERFLRDFKAQVFASQLSSPIASSRCARDENHPGAPEPAVVCQGCYDHLQERVDVLEAALHMDLKEAAQIVYDAVWADPSDSTKTYENAAHALLAELRKRSGVTPVFGLLQPLSD